MDTRIIAEELVDQCNGMFPAIAKTAGIEIDPTLYGYVMSLDEGMRFDGASAYQIAVVVLPVIAIAAAKLKEITAILHKSKGSAGIKLVLKFYAYDENTKQLQRVNTDEFDESGKGNDGSGDTC